MSIDDRDYRRQARRNITIVVLLLAVTASARLVSQGGCSHARQPAIPTRERVPLRFDEVEVLDGDTVRVRGHTIRFLGADTPEVASPYFNGDQQPWGGRASQYSRDSLRAASRIEIVVVEQQDRYGRFLAHVFVDDESLSLRLVKAGLAYETITRFGDYGFTQLGRELVKAAAQVQPEFENPANWRARNRLGD